MKYCIIYSTKTGSTKRCAALLAANLGINNCDLFSISDKLPDIMSYDFLIAGSFVRMGKPDLKIVRLISRYMEKIPYAFYLCGMVDGRFSNVLKKHFPEAAFENSIVTDFFGADYKPEMYHGFGSIITAALIKAGEDDPSLEICTAVKPDRISMFAREITEIFE